MKKTAMFTTAALLLAALLAAATGCGNSIPYNNYLDEKQGYDKELFYENLGDIQAADPCVITVGDTFYLYATSAEVSLSCINVRAWRSKNLSDWEALGPVFIPARDAWAVNTLWAPEVIEKDGTYYMYYSGRDLNKERMGIGVAYSDSPAGPFHEYEGTGEKLYPHTSNPFNIGYPAIDPHVFIDDDGSAYLYFSRDQVSRESSIMGCRLEDDMITIASGTLTEEPIIRPSQEWESPNVASRWNEAPYVIKHGGKYYLTYSANYYQSRFYAVGVAVSDEPLSGYEKVDYNPVLAVDPDWNYVSGTGHNSFFPSPDGKELWIAYHSHIDVEQGGSTRKINFDRVTFDGDRLIVCGPSISPQPLPSGVSAYGNLARDAIVSGEGDVALLTDGIISYSYAESERYEYYAEKKAKITFTFDEPVSVKAVMVYDSADYEYSAKTVDISFDKGGIGGLKFNPAYRYIDEYDFPVKIPGSAAIAEFDEIETTAVTVTIPKGVAIGEIVILGRKGGTV